MSACTNAAQFTFAAECEHRGKVRLMTEEGGGTLVTCAGRKLSSFGFFKATKWKKARRFFKAEICDQLCFYLPPSVKAESKVSLAAVK